MTEFSFFYDFLNVPPLLFIDVNTAVKTWHQGDSSHNDSFTFVKHNRADETKPD